MFFSRRSLLAGLGLTLPFGLAPGSGKAQAMPIGSKSLRFLRFEDAIRAAFADRSAGQSSTRTVEVGDSEVGRAGLQGCVNDRPFAGFPAGHLRIVRSGSRPGPSQDGVRLYVSTVDVVDTGGTLQEGKGRPFDFSTLPAAPTFC